MLNSFFLRIMVGQFSEEWFCSTILKNGFGGAIDALVFSILAFFLFSERLMSNHVLLA